MCSEFTSFDLGPNSQMLLPEKDHLNDDDDHSGPHQFRLLLTRSSPATSSDFANDQQQQQLLCGILTPISHDSTSSSSSSSSPVQQQQPLDHQQEEEEEEAVADNDCVSIDYPELAVKFPPTSSGQELINDGDGGVRTPTSPGSRIPSVLTCPPAPRKAKSRPITTKRKLMEGRRVLFVDLSPDEINSLFSPRAADLYSGGGKKARQ